MIMVDDICYFKADSKYTLVVEESGDSIIRKSIRELTDELDPAMFWQIHRSTLVNVAAIDSGVARQPWRHAAQAEAAQRAVSP